MKGKLNRSQQCALKAMKANCVPGCISERIVDRSRGGIILSSTCSDTPEILCTVLVSPSLDVV